MLQQTQVSTVVPYYERFMRSFPGPRALASATEDKVLSLWSGLGYYRRARLLHAGVREVVARYDAALPRDPQKRRSLPGIGAYTSGAIGSIAFGLPEPIVDGNVARVLCRVFAIRTPLGQAGTEQRLWSLASQLVVGPDPGDFNQAMMELGATICGKKPACVRCPIRNHCAAHQLDLTDTLPMPRKRKPPVDLDCVAVLPVRSSSQPSSIWMVKGKRRLFEGLWGLPMAVGSTRDSACQALTEAGITGRLSAQPLANIKHDLSHRKLHVTLWQATGASAAPTEDRREISSAEVQAMGLSTLTRKLLDAGKLLRL